MLRTDVNGTTVVSALRARANFGKLLRLAAPRGASPHWRGIAEKGDGQAYLASD